MFMMELMVSYSNQLNSIHEMPCAQHCRYHSFWYMASFTARRASRLPKLFNATIASHRTSVADCARPERIVHCRTHVAITRTILLRDRVQ